MQLQSGTLLQGGKYKIERVLGQGGFGITYLAKQELFDRHVCIKEFFFNDYCERGSQGEVTSCTTSSKELVDRFLNKFIKEARTISRLDHPNIVRILDIFQENGTAYYAMEYIEGCSLADKVNEQGALSEAVAVDYIKQVASALDYIHQRSINHLDVKPANIMVRQSDNKAILIDFGLSKQYDEQGGQTSTTPVGISHGYAPMEQYNQGGVSTFSPQTDIYALGATLYKLVTGSTPPQAIEVFNEGLTGLPQSLSPNLAAAIKKTMQPRRTDRPQSISEFRALLGGQYAASVSTTTAQNRDDESTRVIGVTSSEPIKKTLSSQPIVTKVEESKGKKMGRKWGYILAVCIVGVALLFVWNNGLITSVDKSLTPEELYIEASFKHDEGDYAQAFLLWEKAANMGHINAQTELAHCYYLGEGIAQNNTKALEWYIKAANQGNSIAQCSLGLCYYRGIGVSKDLQEAKKWFEKSASQGCEESRKYLKELDFSSISGVVNGHEFIDLGLSVKWATCNVGASNESDFGEYFNYPVINQKDWSGWRLPTKDEYEELLRDCSWSWTRVNDSMGYLVVGKNGNSIFIPAAGNNRIHANEKGWYWTSTPFNETQNKQSVLYISENEKKLAWSLCYAVNTSMRLVTE